MTKLKHVFCLILLLHSFLLLGQNQSKINDEINNLVHETVNIESPSFEAIDEKIADDFVKEIILARASRSSFENDLYSLKNEKSGVRVVFKEDNTSIFFDDETINNLKIAFSIE